MISSRRFSSACAANDQPVLEYEAVPTPLVEPRARTYGKVEDKNDTQEQDKSAVAAK